MNQPTPETFISIDVETTGPIPGPYSMISLGAAAFNQEGDLLSTFSANLEELPGAGVFADTHKFWATHPEAYNATLIGRQDPTKVMQDFVEWVKRLDGWLVPVCYPASWDFMFVYWYMIKFGQKSPFFHSCLDMRSYAMAMQKKPWREVTKRNFPRRWFSPGNSHSHIAMTDAIEQGNIFINMMKDNQ